MDWDQISTPEVMATELSRRTTARVSISTTNGFVPTVTAVTRTAKVVVTFGVFGRDNLHVETVTADGDSTSLTVTGTPDMVIRHVVAAVAIVSYDDPAWQSADGASGWESGWSAGFAAATGGQR